MSKDGVAFVLDRPEPPTGNLTIRLDEAAVAKERDIGELGGIDLG